MPKKRRDILDFLDSYAFRILVSLKDNKNTYSVLMKNSGLVRSNFNNRLVELLKLGLVKVEYAEEMRKPFYSLTLKGKRILELLEEIKRVYRK
jgi:DNA-binding HxlR family transcriptional regulator